MNTIRRKVDQMHTLVIYDSKFGNTRNVAIAIADAMRTAGDATVEVQSTEEFISFPEGLDLLVLGAPTQAHGVEATMRDFVASLPMARLENLPVAVFDTRVHWPKLLSGSAAESIAKSLTRNGGVLVEEPESFFVDGREGPLSDGELRRAAGLGHVPRQPVEDARLTLEGRRRVAASLRTVADRRLLSSRFRRPGKLRQRVLAAKRHEAGAGIRLKLLAGVGNVVVPHRELANAVLRREAGLRLLH